MPLGINAVKIVVKRRKIGRIQKFDFRETDTVLTGNGASEPLYGFHHQLHGFFAELHHLIVVGIERNVGVDIAVAGMHVQRDEYAASEDLVVDFIDLGSDFFKRITAENTVEFTADLPLPGNPQHSVINRIKEFFPCVGFKGLAVSGNAERQKTAEDVFKGIV